MKELDLHGVLHELVENMVIRFIEQYWNTNTELVFITGNSIPMKELVIKIFKEYKLEYQDGNWYNPGFLKTIV